MLRIDREELAWAAGFFDGEGCFTSGAKKGSPRAGKYPIVRITQKDRGVLDRFRRAVCLGDVRGPYTSGKTAVIYSYDAHGVEKTQAIGAMLWRFLSRVKRTQFRTRMEAADWKGLRRDPEHRKKIGEGIREFYRVKHLRPKGGPVIVKAIADALGPGRTGFACCGCSRPQLREPQPRKRTGIYRDTLIFTTREGLRRHLQAHMDRGDLIGDGAIAVAQQEASKPKIVLTDAP